VALTFYSFSEDKFYRGDFPLPYEKIAKLFADGYRSYDHRTSSHITYDGINAGATIGGAVAVWVEGIGRRQEVFFGYAQEFDGNWQQLLQMPVVKKVEIREEALREAAKSDPLIERYMIEPPLGLWEKYRTPYLWHLRVEGVPDPRKSVRYDFFNGERFDLPFPMKPDQLSIARPLPNHIDFEGQLPGRDHRTWFQYDFDEREIFEAFDQFGGDEGPIEMVFRRVLRDGAYRYSVVLRRGDREVPLEKTKVQLNRVPSHVP